MSSLSGKQVGEIKNLYESIYTEETVDETVEVSYDEYSDEERSTLGTITDDSDIKSEDDSDTGTRRSSNSDDTQHCRNTHDGS